jgi:DNA-binding protein H-NS
VSDPDQRSHLPRRASAGAVKYRDPAHYTSTWSGKGRMPNWLQAYVSLGRNREDFLV